MKKYFLFFISLALIATSFCNVFALGKNAYSFSESYITDCFSNASIESVTDYVHNNPLVKEDGEKINYKNGATAIFDFNGKLLLYDNLINIAQRRGEIYFNCVEDAICYIEQNILDDSYTLTQMYNSDYRTLSLRYEKILSDDLLNQYDSYSIYIDTESNMPSFIHKHQSNYVLSDKTILPESVIIDYLNEILPDILQNDSYTIQKAIYKNRDLIDEELLVYAVSNEEKTIYIDAYDKTFIADDYKKEIRGGAIGSPYLYTAFSCMNLAKNGLESMGYVTTNTIYSDIFNSTVPSLLKSAFYACSHGSSSSILSGSGASSGYYYASSIPSDINTKFVFLDACQTAYDATWSNAFKIYNSSNKKAFIGWSESVYQAPARDFCELLWSTYISTNTPIRQAAIYARAHEGSGLPLVFVGDQTYNGYYY